MVASVFGTLRDIRGYARKHLAFVETVEDLDLLVEIGYRQEAGQPVAPKELLALRFASAATVQRRLSRLRKLGAVEQQPSPADRRSLRLVLSTGVLQAFEACGALFRI